MHMRVSKISCATDLRLHTAEIQDPCQWVVPPLRYAPTLTEHFPFEPCEYPSLSGESSVELLDLDRPIQTILMSLLPKILSILVVFSSLGAFATPAFIPQIDRNTTLGAQPRCWVPQTTPVPLIYRECRDIIRQITMPRGFDPSIPLSFSRALQGERPDIRLPFTWQERGKDCIVGIDIPRAVGGSDTTSLNDIKDAAEAIAVECVIRPRHLGGTLTIGWHNRLNVVIVSQTRPPGLTHLLTNGTIAEE